ncbi:MAG: GTP-binding protein, partial [Kiritimatiellae bacterium]|nr:GTP-binding protein [Kiritimatiellia bacterium]
MAEMVETPSGNRVRISFFGKRNAGKSTLANALTGQNLAIVSDVAGTTTDPVSKAMEILPLGPCLVTDTAGLDDEGELGAERVRKSLAVLAATDVAVLVYDCARGVRGREACEARVWDDCAKRGVPVVEFFRGDAVEALKDKLAAIRLADAARPLVADMAKTGDVVALVCPQDGSAPKGRLILPQQQVIRELLDAHAVPVVCQVEELPAVLAMKPALAITDSQAFGAVSAMLPDDVPLTSFSILFARAKGDLRAFCAGAAALDALKDGDRILVSEGCTHRRQCGDIGSVKLPAWIRKRTGKELSFAFSSGGDFPEDLSRYALVVHCGGCMLTRRAVLARIARCEAAGVPVVNYGICIA